MRIVAIFLNKESQGKPDEVEDAPVERMRTLGQTALQSWAQA